MVFPERAFFRGRSYYLWRRTFLSSRCIGMACCQCGFSGEPVKITSLGKMITYLQVSPLTEISPTNLAGFRMNVSASKGLFLFSLLIFFIHLVSVDILSSCGFIFNYIDSINSLTKINRSI